MQNEYKLSLTAKEIDNRLVKIGNPSGLKTSSDEIVGAINELNEKTGDVSRQVTYIQVIPEALDEETLAFTGCTCDVENLFGVITGSVLSNKEVNLLLAIDSDFNLVLKLSMVDVNFGAEFSSIQNFGGLKVRAFAQIDSENNITAGIEPIQNDLDIDELIQTKVESYVDEVILGGKW